MSQAPRVLVVEDDDATRLVFCELLRAHGFVVAEAWSVVQAMRLLLSFNPGAVVLDLVLPDGHGEDVGRAMRAIVTTRRTCVVAVTGHARELVAVDPETFGARNILIKPVESEALIAAVTECFEEPDASDAVDAPIAPPLPDEPPLIAPL